MSHHHDIDKAWLKKYKCIYIMQIYVDTYKRICMDVWKA